MGFEIWFFLAKHNLFLLSRRLVVLQTRFEPESRMRIACSVGLQEPTGFPAAFHSLPTWKRSTAVLWRTSLLWRLRHRCWGQNDVSQPDSLYFRWLHPWWVLLEARGVREFVNCHWPGLVLCSFRAKKCKIEMCVTLQWRVCLFSGIMVKDVWRALSFGE